MSGFIFKQDLTPQDLAQTLAEKVFPAFSNFLYSEISGQSSVKLTKDEALPKFEALFEELLCDLRDNASILPPLVSQSYTQNDIQRMAFDRNSAFSHSVWRKLTNEICEFMMAHTAGGEHEDIPSRAAFMFEKVIGIIKSNIKENLIDNDPSLDVPPRNS